MIIKKTIKSEAKTHLQSAYHIQEIVVQIDEILITKLQV